MINIFKRNIKIKIISICFAFFAWIYVMAEVDPILIKDFNNVAVKITNIDVLQDSNMVIDPKSNLNVKVMLRGRRSLLKDIQKSNLNIYGKFENIKLGENELDLNIDVPNNVTYTIIPDKLVLNVEENMYVRKYIELDKINKLKEDFKISNMNINPEYTYVEGPRSLVKKVDRLVCKVNLKNKFKNFNAKIQIVPLDKYGKKVEGVNIKDKYAYVSVEVLKTKEVPLKINLTGDLDENYKLLGYELEPKNITISGPNEYIDNIKELYVEDFDISGLNEDKSVDLKINIPEKIQTEIKKVNLKINVSKIISKNFIISKNRIVFKGDIHNLDISKNNLPDNIKVKVAYLEDLEEKIKEEDIQLFINMQENEGNHAKFKIKYSMPYDVENVEIEPKYVVIE
ncbi:CdaR family protein [Tepidibacter thalassicus]|uniref:YbbR domain-containing protein n=1 Tax=Tepidibacter thalassicus DSM 15285 TaxID=1123350 RepID=A0A1M5QZH9_9FIRM|nr:CdaR family protein [Tepidibacter thalassicus]SHH19129.1 YbbR domain-containing protein [Tepidibacter thalassicus DSM 15285]